MTDEILLRSADGWSFPVYRAQPDGRPRAAVVVVQEIFGVNPHIRSVADGFAAEGFLALAPDLFDRVRKGVQLGYSPQEVQQGIALKAAAMALPAPGVLADLQAVVDHAAVAGKVGMVGYCWGGLLTWQSAAQVRGLSAAVPYYGGGMTVGAELLRRPACPVQCHFGNADHAIPNETVEAFRLQQAGTEVHLHAAQHGFNCDQRASFNAQAAQDARALCLRFLARHLG